MRSLPICLLLGLVAGCGGNAQPSAPAELAGGSAPAKRAPPTTDPVPTDDRGQERPADDGPRPYPPPGRLVDVGGYKLHINCSGEAKEGGVTVVLLHGLGDFSFDWALVQPEVARFAHVCAYDRAGAQAWSDPGPRPRGPKKVAAELHALLANAGIKPPLVLVGHSWGGIIARVYASQHPKDVVGMVLVDSSHEDQYLWINGKVVRPRAMSDEEWAELRKPRTGRGGPPSAGPTVKKPPAAEKVAPPFDKLPPDVQKMRLWATSLPVSPEALAGGDIEDFRGDLQEAYSLTRGGGEQYPLGDTPLIVLRAYKDGPPEDPSYSQEQHEWNNKKLPQELAGLSRNGKLILTDKSGHHIQLDEPEPVIGAIRQVVEAARSGTRLAR
jgi:pimeloyl-ACP methyl ester carboxylesterase